VKPKGSFFQYVETPQGILNGPTFITAEDFSQYLIKEKLISTVPWDEAGRYVRFSVTFAADEDEEKDVIQELKRRLSDVTFIW
jgi:LL-diaminopimelate aminotransferase